ncbi:MAG: helix-turn-helix domain-containing protein [Thalassotalea sp.]
MPPIINFNSLLLFLAVSQGMIFAILLYFRSKKGRKIHIHLSIILIAFSIEVFQKFLIDTHYIFQFPLLVGSNLPFDACIGIALYWYVRQLTHPEKNNQPQKVIKHYAIFFLCFILSIPYWLMDFDAKLALMENGVISTQWTNLVFYSLGAQAFLKIISFCVYVFLSIKMLIAHKKRVNNIFSYRERITLLWLTNMLWLFLFGLLKGVLGLVFFQQSEEVTSMMGFMEYFSIIVIFYIGIMGLMQPRIYRRSERSYINELKANDLNNEATLVDNSTKTKLTNESDLMQTSPKNKYLKSALSNEDMTRIAKKLDSLMLIKPMYLEPNLSMPQLADALSVSPNYLSQTLNSIYQMSFFDFINIQRIDFAKKQLLDPALSQKSVVEIAIDSAFNSRSAFYSAFKKHVGTTPLQFKKHNKDAVSARN